MIQLEMCISSGFQELKIKSYLHALADCVCYRYY